MHPVPPLSEEEKKWIYKIVLFSFGYHMSCSVYAAPDRPEGLVWCFLGSVFLMGVFSFPLFSEQTDEKKWKKS